MMGIFHLLMVYMSILNKRIDNTGLGDAHVQSSIIAEGSIEAALFGKSYNCGARLHKVFYKALNCLLLSRLDEVLPLADFIHPIKEMDLFSKDDIIKFKDSDESLTPTTGMFSLVFSLIFGLYLSPLSRPPVERNKKSVWFWGKVLLLYCG